MGLNTTKYFDNTEKIIYGFLLVSLFTFPFSLVSNPFLFAMPVIAFLGLDFKAKWINLKENGALPFIAALFVYWMLETIAYFTSGNLEGELSIYLTKLFLFLIPLSLLTLSRSVFTAQRIRWLLGAYIGGCALYVVVTSIYGIGRFLYYDKINYLFYTQLSEWKHPTFIGFMLLFANVILYYLCFVAKRKISRVMKSLCLVLVALQIVYILLLQSKTLLIALVLLSIAACFHLFKILSKRAFFAGFFMLLLFASASVMIFPKSHSRIYNMIATLSLESKPSNSTSYRLIALQSSWEVVKEAPLFGYGLAESKLKLTEAGKQHGLTQEIKPHNQYLHTAIQTGILGLFSFLAVLATVFYCCKKQGKSLFFVLTYLFIFCLVCLFESCWERITMVTYSAVFLSLLVLPLETRKISN